MTIGEKIRELRRREDITQEQLAEYLSISTQAVSKWENNTTLPDITMIVPLANFFKVTPDTLFDFDSEREKKDIEEYNKRSLELLNKGKTHEAIALWREAVAKYPRNFDCLIMLASKLYFSAIGVFDKVEKEAMLNEAIDICERILRDCADDYIRSSARETLVYSYAQFKNETKAAENAMQAQSIHISREVLLSTAYTDPKKSRETTQKLINILFSLFITKAVYMKYESTDKKIQALKDLIKMISLFIPDGNYLFYHESFTSIYMLLARTYASKLDRDNTIDQLKLAFYHAKAYDNLPDSELHYTSVFIDSLTNDKSKNTKNYDSSDADLMRKQLTDTCFDFIRDDPEFKQLYHKQ